MTHIRRFGGNTTPTVFDQFCGAGGSSAGARRRGLRVMYAVNHWALAVESHSANFPDTFHDCADVSKIDPARYGRTDVLITSPECTRHSLASGKKQVTQCDLFGDVQFDLAAERSRATAWDVVRFAETHQYNAIIVENVPQFRKWLLFPEWLRALQKLGYEWQVVYINAMFAHQTPSDEFDIGDFVPQSRDRMFIVLWKKGLPKPNLDFRPQAFCTRCGKDVNAVQSWKKSGPRWGAYGERRQYVYRCPTCSSAVTPYHYAAANIIDWARPMQRIGDRKHPLKPMTMQRIQAGLDKFWGAFTINTSFTQGGDRARHVADPLYTQDTRQSQGVVLVPAIVSMRDTNRDYYQTLPVTSALPTQVATTIQQWLLAAPANTSDHGASFHVSGSTGLLAAPFIAQLRNHSTAIGIDEPLGTITAGGQHHALVLPYYSNALPHTVGDTLRTVTATDRFGLLITSTPPAVDDCLFRMLTPNECKLAQSFPPDYVILGTNRDQVRQIGNANPPVLMDAILERVAPIVQ